MKTIFTRYLILNLNEKSKTFRDRSWDFFFFCNLEYTCVCGTPKALFTRNILGTQYCNKKIKVIAIKISFYQNVFLPIYLNIVCQNVSCE